MLLRSPKGTNPQSSGDIIDLKGRSVDHDILIQNINHYGIWGITNN